MTFRIVRALWDIINSPCVGRVITGTLAVASSPAIPEAGTPCLEPKLPNAIFFFRTFGAEELIYERFPAEI